MKWDFPIDRMLQCAQLIQPWLFIIFHNSSYLIFLYFSWVCLSFVLYHLWPNLENKCWQTLKFANEKSEISTCIFLCHNGGVEGSSGLDRTTIYLCIYFLLLYTSHNDNLMEWLNKTINLEARFLNTVSHHDVLLQQSKTPIWNRYLFLWLCQADFSHNKIYWSSIFRDDLARLHIWLLPAKYRFTVRYDPVILYF